MAGAKKKSVDLRAYIVIDLPNCRFVRYLCGTINSDPGSPVRNWRVPTVQSFPLLYR